MFLGIILAQVLAQFLVWYAYLCCGVSTSPTNCTLSSTSSSSDLLNRVVTGLKNSVNISQIVTYRFLHKSDSFSINILSFICGLVLCANAEYSSASLDICSTSLTFPNHTCVFVVRCGFEKLFLWFSAFVTLVSCRFVKLFWLLT